MFEKGLPLLFIHTVSKQQFELSASVLLFQRFALWLSMSRDFIAALYVCIVTMLNNVTEPATRIALADTFKIYIINHNFTSVTLQTVRLQRTVRRYNANDWRL